MHGKRNLGRAMFGLIFARSMSCADAHCRLTSAPRAQIQYVIDEGPRQAAAAGPMIAPPFKGTDPSRCFARDLRLYSVVARGSGFFDYRAATRFFFLAGAAAAPFGAGHGAWKP